MTRVCLYAWLMAGGLTVAAAATAQELPAGLRVCASESDDQRRLSCYDRAVARWSAETRREAADGAAAAPERHFGLRGEQSRQARGDPPRVASIEARLTGIARRPHGELVMTLDNGQVWKQTYPDPLPLRVGDTVTIKAGAFGSFRLSTASRRSTQVTRLQ